MALSPRLLSVFARLATAATCLSTLSSLSQLASAQPAPEAVTEPPAPPPSTERPSKEPPSPARPPDTDNGIRWNLDARAGVPVLREGDTRIAADLAVGVAGRTFGLDLRGSAGTFDLVRGTSFSQTDRAEGGLDGFIRFGSPVFAPEVHVAGGAAYYGTTVSAPGTLLADDDSILGRGSLLLGFRGETPAIGYLLLVGGGLQLESRSTTTVPGTPSSTAAIDDVDTTSSRFEGRMRLRMPFLSGALAVRFLQEASMFSLTRDASAILVGPAAGNTGVSLTGSTFSVRQIESRTRLAVDVPALSFGPLLPTAFVGLDYVSLTADTGSTTAIVPLAGVGLVHDEKPR